METYDNGAGYTAAKHAQGALHRTLRGELLGKPVRLTEIAPGAVQTEFSLVRFDGDQERAAAVYEGITPLVADDVAEVIGFVASRPSHVNLDLIVIRPRDQASASRFSRRGRRSLIGVPDGRRADRRGRRAGREFPSATRTGVIADIAFQLSQSTAQSQMSPSEYDSWIEVPVTSTGSP